MTPRLAVVVGPVAFAGIALLLSELRWFRRPSLTDRLRPHVPGVDPARSSRRLSTASFREVVAPLSELAGERLSAVFGVSETLERRLRRIHSPLDVTTFRTRQMGWAGAALIGGTLTAIALGCPAPLAIVVVAGAPLLAFLVLEQQVAAASLAWQRTVFLELPVIAEQLGMLMSAGWSLSAALNRIAMRGRGNCSRDLRRVVHRMHQGLGDVDALREWAALADVDALDRLVAVLALNRETADVGRLVSDEARSIRREAQRDLIEAIERRNQQVWIPVTVAALLPGVMLMGVPFVDALRLFSAP